jgi:sec-independent protein translocase protein TatA
MLRNLFDQPLALVVIILLVVVLFGASRLPNAARQVGRSMRIFKSEVKEMKNDGKDDDAARRGTSEPFEARVVHEEHRPHTDPLDERQADTARRDI